MSDTREISWAPRHVRSNRTYPLARSALFLLTACRTPDSDIADSFESDVHSDPLDEPFYPQLPTEHPRLLALPADRATLQSRAHGTDPRLTGLYDRAVAGCTSAPTATVDPANLGGWWTGAIAARDCAFLAWLDDDPVAADRASAALAFLPTSPDAVPLQSEVHLSTALAAEVQALDLLLATDADVSTADPAVRTLVRSAFEKYAVDESAILLISQSNHNLKFAGAIGLASLLFDDEPDAPRWLGFAQGELRRLLVDGALTGPGGGFAEGPYYQAYADDQVVPYLRAYHRLVGPGEHTFAANCDTWPIGTCPDALVVDDLYEAPELHDLWAWSRWIRMPNGQRPPIDDALPIGYPAAFLAESDPYAGWDYSTQADPRLSSAGDAGLDVLAAWDGSVTAPPADPCHVDPTAGMAVLRTSWEPDATWAMLLGESAGPQTSTGHEHPEAGAIQLFAAGRYLVIDTGYAGYDDREWTSSYEDHSGVRIDGEGLPSGHLSDLVVDWPQTGCTPQIAVDHDGVQWSRQLQLVDQGASVTDTFDATSAHRVEMRFHVLTGADRGTAELRSWGAVVHIDGVTLAIATGGPSVTWSLDTGKDAFTYGAYQEHDVVVATFDAPIEAHTALAVSVGTNEPAVQIDNGHPIVDGVRY